MRINQLINLNLRGANFGGFIVPLAPHYVRGSPMQWTRSQLDECISGHHFITYVELTYYRCIEIKSQSG